MIWRALTCAGAARTSEDLDRFVAAVAALDACFLTADDGTRLSTALAALDRQLREFGTEMVRARRETAALCETLANHDEVVRLLEASLPFRADDARRAALAASAARVQAMLDGLKPLAARERREERLAAEWSVALHGAVRSLRGKLARGSVAAVSHDNADTISRVMAASAAITASLDAINRESARARAGGLAHHVRTALAGLAALSRDANVATALTVLRATPMHLHPESPTHTQTPTTTPSSVPAGIARPTTLQDSNREREHEPLAG